MDNLLLKSLSPQAAKVYGLLLKHKTLSAKDIASRIKIVPNTVYRDLKELMRLGLVQTVDGYPIKYQAKPAAEAVAFYTNVIRQNFYETFGLGENSSDNLKISFFQTRADFIKKASKDYYLAKTNINTIISGHEVPAEPISVYKKAVERGVIVRRMIQHLNAENIASAKNWKKIGVETRYTPLMHARIVIVDGKITHFGSYSPEKQPESVGVRFHYAPFAKLMDETFEQKWAQAKII